MSTKKPRSPKKTAAKRPTKKDLKTLAEVAFQKALEAEYVAPLPEITPLELAHLVAALGLGDQADGPSKALSLVSRCHTYIDGMKTQFRRFNDVLAQGRSDDARILVAMGLSPEPTNITFSIGEVIAKMSTAPLEVSGKKLRGRPLWDEFCRQVDPLLGRPGEVREDGTSPQLYSLADLMHVFRKFHGWRDKIAAENLAKCAKNITKANLVRKESASTDGADAEDAVEIPKMRQ